jgi:hypothetical protein
VQAPGLRLEGTQRATLPPFTFSSLSAIPAWPGGNRTTVPRILYQSTIVTVQYCSKRLDVLVPALGGPEKTGNGDIEYGNTLKTVVSLSPNLERQTEYLLF